MSDQIPVDQIPPLDASKISSGVFDEERIPNLDASKITSGTLAADRIPELDASKITSGVLATNRGGTGASSVAQARTNLGLGTAATSTYTVSTGEPTGGKNGDVWYQVDE